MSTMTIRLPDDKHERLKALARSNSISVNELMDELATVALANHDARVRFETRAARGNPKRALSLLDKLDRADRLRAARPGLCRACESTIFCFAAGAAGRISASISRFPTTGGHTRRCRVAQRRPSPRPPRQVVARAGSRDGHAHPRDLETAGHRTCGCIPG